MNYSSKSVPNSRIQELPTVTATELKNSTADVFDQVSKTGAVAITRHDKPRAVLLTVDQYAALTQSALPGLDGLKREYEQMLDDMQKPEQREAARRAFNATPEELGATGLAYMKAERGLR
jgi:antitoxin Phd